MRAVALLVLWAMIAARSFSLAYGQASAPTAETRFAFVGYLAVGQEIQFVIGSEKSGATRWVRTGERLDDFVVGAFDIASETLSLMRGDERIELKLQGGAAQPSAPSAPELSLADAQAIARRELALRDHWENVRLRPGRTPKGDFQFYVMRQSPATTDRRVIVVTPEGRVKFYLTLPTQPHAGMPDLLFGSFSTSAKAWAGR